MALLQKRDCNIEEQEMQKKDSNFIWKEGEWEV